MRGLARRTLEIAAVGAVLWTVTAPWVPQINWPLVLCVAVALLVIVALGGHPDTAKGQSEDRPFAPQSHQRRLQPASTPRSRLMQDMTNPTGAPPPGTPGVAVSDRAVADGTLALIAEDEELLAALGAPRPSLATREAAAADVIMERLAHDEGFPSVAARQQAAHDMQIVAEAALADLIASGRAPQEWWQLEHETRVAYRLHQDRVPNAVITGGQLAILAQAIDAVWLAYLERLGVALPPHRLRTVIAKAAAATTEAA